MEVQSFVTVWEILGLSMKENKIIYHSQCVKLMLGHIEIDLHLYNLWNTETAMDFIYMKKTKNRPLNGLLMAAVLPAKQKPDLKMCADYFGY